MEKLLKPRKYIKKDTSAQPEPEKETNISGELDTEEPTTQQVSKDVVSTLGIYPSCMVENFERMLSTDALNTEDIQKENPHIRLRYLNKPYRMTHGKMNEWQPAEHGKDRPVGDLTLGFMPKDQAILKEQRQFERSIIKTKEEDEKQQELAEKIYRDSEGAIRAIINGQDRQKGQRIGTKTYFTVPAQIS